nr:MAG TPA: hypothetical protein [Caudoviricetes sp.]
MKKPYLIKYFYLNIIYAFIHLRIIQMDKFLLKIPILNLKYSLNISN